MNDFDRSLAIDDLSRRQHGLVTTTQALEALGGSRKDRWVRQGRLICVQPAVYRVLGVPTTWHQELKALELATEGVVSHRSAAELWGLIQPAGHLEVSIPGRARRTVRPPAVAHRIHDLHPELAEEREGFRLTDPVRTVIDLGLVMPRASVQRAVTAGVTTGLLTLPDVRRLRDALGRPGRNGTGVVRQILDGGVLPLGQEESILEVRFTSLARRFGLPPMSLQHQVWHGGRFVARIDAALPDLKLAIEVDGYAHHSPAEAFQRDRTRQNRLVALGWTVLRFTWTDIVQRPGEVAEAIRDAINRLSAA